MDGWFVTASEIIDRFLALKNVVLFETEKAVYVINTGEADILGITLMCSHRTILYDSKNMSYVSNTQGEIVLNTLGAKSNITLYKEKVSNFGPTLKRIEIGRIERMKIEFMNYIGGILSKLSGT